VDKPKLSKFDLQILEALWNYGKASIREIQEAFPEPRPAYSTVQTIVYRRETRAQCVGSEKLATPIQSRSRLTRSASHFPRPGGALHPKPRLAPDNIRYLAMRICADRIHAVASLAANLQHRAWRHTSEDVGRG